MSFHSFNFSGRSAESSNIAGGIAAAEKRLKTVTRLKRKISQKLREAECRRSSTLY